MLYERHTVSPRRKPRAPSVRRAKRSGSGASQLSQYSTREKERDTMLRGVNIMPPSVIPEPVSVVCVDLGSPEGVQSLASIDRLGVMGPTVPEILPHIPASPTLSYGKPRDVSPPRKLILPDAPLPPPLSLPLPPAPTPAPVSAPQIPLSVLHTANKEIAALKKVISEMQTAPVIVKDTSAEGEVVSLSDEVHRLTEKVEASDEQLERLRSEHNDLQTQNRKLESELTRSTRKCITEQEDGNRKGSRAAFLESRVSQLEREKETLQIELHGLQADTKGKIELSVELEALRRENLKLKTNLEGTHTELVNLRLQHDLLQKKNDTVEEANRKAHERLAILEQTTLDNTFLGNEVRKYKAMAEEMDLKQRETEKKHEEELSRSDFIHARQCNDLVKNIEDARQIRDQKTREIVDLKMKLEQCEKRELVWKDEMTGVAGLKKEYEYMEEDLAENRKELARLKEENDMLKGRTNHLVSQDSIRGEDARQAFEKLRSAYDDVCMKNDRYRAQLRQATTDFKTLQDSHALAEDKAANILTQADVNNRKAITHLSDIERNLAHRSLPHSEEMLTSIRLAMRELGGRWSQHPQHP